MKKTLRTVGMLMLVLAMLLTGWAMAEENVKVADLTSLKETGALFEGVTPGLTKTELQLAGFPVRMDMDTLALDELTGGRQSAIFRQNTPGNPQIMLGELKMADAEFHIITGMTASMVMDMALIPAEGTSVSDVEATISAVLGEAQEGAWAFEAGGHRIRVSLEAQGEICTRIRVDYLNLIEGAKLPVDVQKLRDEGILLEGAVMGASEEEVRAALILQSGEATDSFVGDSTIVNRVLPLRLEQMAWLGDIPMKDARCQFWGGKLINVSMSPAASATMEQVLAILEPVMGEKSERLSKDGRLLGYQWNWEAGGHEMQLLVSLYKEGDVDYCAGIDLRCEDLIAEVRAAVEAK